MMCDVIQAPISIHTLRGEGDFLSSSITLKSTVGFQSTPSVGRATVKNRQYRINAKKFQSTPSVGRATKTTHEINLSQNDFNPHPPWGGRPIGHTRYVNRRKISIHALRGEGDNVPVLSAPAVQYFNPRPPWGGRQLTGAGRPRSRKISIHALRGEGDTGFVQIPITICDFNPRPPWGGRQQKHTNMQHCVCT